MKPPQRLTTRFPFSADAEIIRPETQTVEKTRVNEISTYGCYLDRNVAVQRGAQVVVKITSRGSVFEASATVLYSQPTLGTGLAFRELKPKDWAILQGWLQQALEKQNAPPPSISDFSEDR